MRTFPGGSLGGKYDLKPQHTMKLIGCPDAGAELVTAITALVSILSVYSCSCPSEMHLVLFEGTIFAPRKKFSDLRPVLIGYYWRRLASKCAVAYAMPRMTTYL